MGRFCEENVANEAGCSAAVQGFLALSAFWSFDL